MQRVCTKLRSMAVHSLRSSSQLLHHSTHSSSSLASSSSTKWSSSFSFWPLNNITSYSHRSLVAPCFRSSLLSNSLPLSLVLVRHVSSRDRRNKRKPITPLKSKIKKTKMKSYASYKSRFRTMNDGNIRRWREGKNHNAHLKSKKSRRRLRQPALVPAAYAKVMKKLNFCG